MKLDEYQKHLIGWMAFVIAFFIFLFCSFVFLEHKSYLTFGSFLLSMLNWLIIAMIFDKIDKDAKDNLGEQK